MIHTIDATELMLLQRTFKECRETFEATGNHGWATFCRAQERILIKEARTSFETLGFARDASKKAREIERNAG